MEKMKKIFLMIVICCMFILSGCGGPPQKGSGGAQNNWDSDGALKILTIGNSFSDDAMEYVWNIANDAGVEGIYLGNLFIGSCTLDIHASNARTNAAAYDFRVNESGVWRTTPRARLGDVISSFDWDFISLQQASGDSGIAESYRELPYLIEFIKEQAISEPVIAWNMTWAYQQNSTHGEFWKYDKSQSKMYDMILSCVQANVKSREEIGKIIPCGTAIQNARTSLLGDTLTRDGFHLSYGAGRYIAGLTLFHFLTGISLDGLTYKPSTVTEEEMQIALESAKNAVSVPYAVTPSQYV